MPTPGSELPPNVQAALRAGRTIDAIKLLRKATGLGLQEAKERIDAERATAGAAVPEGQVPGALPAHVLQALLAGNRLEAIRLFRSHAGIGLKAAKEAIDAFAPPDPRAPGEVPRRSGFPWFLALGVAGAVAYFYFRS